jgi:hypothetical protein
MCRYLNKDLAVKEPTGDRSLDLEAGFRPRTMENCYAGAATKMENPGESRKHRTFRKSVGGN